ncbi:MAG: hypothetical protein A2542_02350 [Parcubacteria group bacterium RIFOXYD2_FULL_52_8]|nr:MAG: hypothetical protein A2542_02350 [Parcubacteria group bacterium RIFOXYD2_FULL_52_8]
MNVTVEVAKNQNESNTSVIRRFTKRVQDAGILKRARSLRYAKRSPSPYAKKKGALSKLTKRKEFEKLKRLGKVEEGYHKKTWKR